AMAFLDLSVRLPGASISLGVFKKEFQIRSGGWRIVFDEQHYLAACTLDQAAKVVIALGRVAGENASFAQHLSQQGFECAHFIMLLGNRTLVHHDACL